MLSALCYRPSVRLPVTRVNHTKTVEVRIMKFYHTIAPSLWFLRSKFHPEILTGSAERKTSHFLPLNVSTSKTVGNTIND